MTEYEKFTVSGSQLVDKVKQLIKEGNVSKIRILHGGQVMLEMPLTIGAGAAAALVLAAPILAAVGAFAALITDCTLEVERIKPEKK